MKKRVIIKSMARRIVAVSIIGSMALTGIEMMDSSAFNGMVSGDGLLSGNGALSGDANLSGDVVMSGDSYWKNEYNDTEEKVIISSFNENNKVRKVGESYNSAPGPSIYDVVLETQTDAENDVKKQYKSYSDVKISSSFLKVPSNKDTLDTHNFEQNDLNDDYNSRYSEVYDKKPADGTCTEVAITSSAEFFNRMKITSIKKFKYTTCFVNVLYCAKMNGAWVYEYDKKEDRWKGSTYNAKTYKIINDYYKMKKEKLFGVYDPTPQYDYIKDRLEAGKSVLGHFEVLKPNGKVDGHCMNINGILYVKVRYRNSSKDSYKSKNVIYYVVNDGWHNCDSGNYRIQYINSKYIDTMTCFGPVS